MNILVFLLILCNKLLDSYRTIAESFSLSHRLTKVSIEKYFVFGFSDEEFNNAPEKMEGYTLYQYLIISADNNPFFLNNPADKI